MTGEGKRYIIDTIESMSGSRNPYQIFRDWCELFSISMANACTFFRDRVWEEREETYRRIWQQYGKREQDKFIQMSAGLVNAFEEEPSDHLGDIYMRTGCGNKSTGQFFTPYHISELAGRLLINTEEEPPYVINEPSCGGGGMIIAAAMALRDKGIDYQQTMRVTAQDLDWLAVYMTYIQLSLMGINAVVVQGDTLIEPGITGKRESRIFRTPKNRGVLI